MCVGYAGESIAHIADSTSFRWRFKGQVELRAAGDADEVVFGRVHPVFNAGVDGTKW